MRVGRIKNSAKIEMKRIQSIHFILKHSHRSFFSVYTVLNGYEWDSTQLLNLEIPLRIDFLAAFWLKNSWVDHRNCSHVSAQICTDDRIVAHNYIPFS